MMKNIKTFYQLFESLVQLRPSNYWSFVVFFTDERIGATRLARFLVSGDSSKTITTKFLEDLLPQYLGFDSLYTLSPDIAPPSIDGFMQFGGWIHDNIDEISDRAGLDKMYVQGREIQNGIDFPEFLDAFEDEQGSDEYTEIYGDPNNIAWLIMNYLRGDQDRMLVDIFEFFNSKVGNPVGANNHMLTIGEKYRDILIEIFNSNDSDWIYGYFKNNPLELHIVHDKEMREKIILKTGIKDFSKLGRGLKSGLI
jgi:hypothetical protein